MSSSATRLRTTEGPCSGLWLAEQAPEEMLTEPKDFLAPYGEGGGGLR
jgi:hypothetical protein